jgi:phage shock protein PspC (stress-responsive transcriptional regulator)
MNEISRIHLARVSYEIDLDAKKELEKYLGDIKKSLGQETDAMEDIEIRMSEILAERGVVKDSVITSGDVAALRTRLGDPRDFADDAASGKDSDNWRDNLFTRGKDDADRKYYRDPDNAVLGGVIAGLAAYTGWDVTLLRVLAVVLAIIPSWGTLIIVYIVVWICAPEAKSVSEKMAMRGEAINLDSLKESAKKFGEKAEAAGQEMAAKAEQIGQQFESKASGVGAKIGRVVAATLGAIGVMVCTAVMCGLIISCVWLIPILVAISGGVSYAPLLAVAVGLALSAVFMMNISGMILSSMLISGRTKARGSGLLATVIVSSALLVAAAVASIGWVSLSPPENIQYIKESIIKKVNVHVEGGGDNVYVEIEPFLINVEST